ncbi:MAG: hypothetical protein FWE37_02250 [Spirochaetaceae bacterium]|nr:hypothetical protein [Spirochaetaceae bacterium]
MEKENFTKWDMADNFKTKEDVINYIKVAIEDNDLYFLFKIFEAISRSKFASDFNLNNNKPSLEPLLNTLGFSLKLEKINDLQMA